MTTKQPTRKIIRTQAAKPAELPATQPTVEPVYGPIERKIVAPRPFDTCTGCNSAVLKGYVNPKSGLCKICDARRLRDQVNSYERTGEASASREQLVPDFGHDQEETDEADESLDPMLSTSRTEKGRKLELAATKLIEQALIRDADKARAKPVEDLNETAKTDPIQAAMNKARKNLGVELQSRKVDTRRASEAQQRALGNIGHNIADVINARLTVAEASRLLQAGPTWLKK